MHRLVEAGIPYIEAGSFVSPKWVPQMANSDEVFKQLDSLAASHPNVVFSGLTPNMKGLEGALAVNCKEVAIFCAASESFSKKNINMTTKEALTKQGEVTSRAIQSGERNVLCFLFCSLPQWLLKD